YLAFLALRAVARRTPGAVIVCAGVAAGLAPVLAAIFFTVEYAVGGNDAATVTTVAAAMIGVHVLIGIGEGILTGLTVGAVMAVRPDLVYGARDLMARDGPPAALAVH